MSNIEQETKIGLEHIRKVYPEKKKKETGRERVVLNDISLDIEKGEFFSCWEHPAAGKPRCCGSLPIWRSRRREGSP